MASLHKKPDSSCWHCAFYLPNGRRTLRSTGSKDKKVALRVCLEFEKAATEGRNSRLTEARARSTIAAIYELANQESLSFASLETFLKEWLQRKRGEVSGSSYPEYANSVKALLQYLGEKSTRSVDAITNRDLAGFRDHLAAKVSGTTVNKTLKILRGAWFQAVRDGILRDNAFQRIQLVKATGSKRRAFTAPEVKAILNGCDEEWRGIVLFGLYTGQRLGDIARLTWRNIELRKNQKTGEVYFFSEKPDAYKTKPLVGPLYDYVARKFPSKNPDAPLFPTAASLATKRIGPVSNAFHEILVRVNLATGRTHQREGSGRNTKRNVSGLSFHCFRHTATSWLKASGVSEGVTREIIGHESEAVNRKYTHIDTATMRAALAQLPDVTSLGFGKQRSRETSQGRKRKRQRPE